MPVEYKAASIAKGVVFYDSPLTNPTCSMSEGERARISGNNTQAEDAISELVQRSVGQFISQAHAVVAPDAQLMRQNEGYLVSPAMQLQFGSHRLGAYIFFKPGLDPNCRCAENARQYTTAYIRIDGILPIPQSEVQTVFSYLESIADSQIRHLVEGYCEQTGAEVLLPFNHKLLYLDGHDKESLKAVFSGDVGRGKPKKLRDVLAKDLEAKVAFEDLLKISGSDGKGEHFNYVCAERTDHIDKKLNSCTYGVSDIMGNGIVEASIANRMDLGEGTDMMSQQILLSSMGWLPVGGILFNLEKLHAARAFVDALKN